VWTLEFTATPAHYVKSKLYKFPSSKAIGYYDNPPPNPAWKLLVAQSPYQQVAYDPTALTPPQVLPWGLPPKAPIAGVIDIPFTAGDANVFIPGIVPKQIFPTTFKIRRVTLLAEAANAARVWLGYRNTVAIGAGFPLAPSAARDEDISDLSDIWLVAANATDKVYFIYET